MKQTHEYLVKKRILERIKQTFKVGSRQDARRGRTEHSKLRSGQGHGSTWVSREPGLEEPSAAWGWGPRTFRTTGLPSLMSWASIMATLWSMVVEWSVLSAELPTNVPRAKTAAQRTCGRDRGQSLRSRLFGSGWGPWSLLDAAQSRLRSSQPSSTCVDKQSRETRG